MNIDLFSIQIIVTIAISFENVLNALIVRILRIFVSVSHFPFLNTILLSIEKNFLYLK